VEEREVRTFDTVESRGGFLVYNFPSFYVVAGPEGRRFKMKEKPVAKDHSLIHLFQDLEGIL
jgi:hypothetical protein